MSQFWTIYPDIHTELEAIYKIISEIHKMREPYLDMSLDYLFESRGKMLRPAFLVIGSHFGEKRSDREKIRTIGAAIETLHIGTLVHDDIIDEAYLRRGKETIQSKYSKEYAVYMGDYLFSQCFLMLANHEIDVKILKEISRGVSRICKGEMMQNYMRYHQDVTLRQYLEIIRGKTAALFALSLFAGAFQNGAPEALCIKLGKIGLHIGMAFQIVDDLLDYTSSPKEMGKDVQADILKGYYTLPLLFSLQTDKKSEIEGLLKSESFTTEDIPKLFQIVRGSGAIQKTEELAARYTQKALSAIKTLPEGTGKEYLEQIVPLLLKRKY